MKYVELYYDAEDKQAWCITLWEIDQKDFDPMTCDFINMPGEHKNIHDAKAAQDTLVWALRATGEVVYQNTYNPDAHFWIRPRWLEEMLAQIINKERKIVDDEYTNRKTKNLS